MKTLFLRLRPLLAAALLVCTACAPSAVMSQQKAMSVEELDQYIQEQKAALKEAISNRDETAAKAREVQEALAEQDARRELLEMEVEELCLEHEAVESGSYDDCKAQFSS